MVLILCSPVGIPSYYPCESIDPLGIPWDFPLVPMVHPTRHHMGFPIGHPHRTPHGCAEVPWGALFVKSDEIPGDAYPDPEGHPMGRLRVSYTSDGKSHGECHRPWEEPWNLMRQIVERSDVPWDLLLDLTGLPIGGDKAHGTFRGTHDAPHG